MIGEGGMVKEGGGKGMGGGKWGRESVGGGREKGERGNPPRQAGFIILA